jgi:guanylate kinase
LIIAIIGVSASGKTTLQKQLNIPKVTTFTTREPRVGEALDSYNFVTVEEFKTLKANGTFLETAIINGNFYGSPKILPPNSSIVLNAHGVESLRKIREDILVVGCHVSSDTFATRLVSRADPSSFERLLSYTNESRKVLELADIIINTEKPVSENVLSMLETIAKK